MKRKSLEEEQFTCFIRNKRFQLLSKSIYFDTEFLRLHSLFKELKDVFDMIARRQSLGDSLDLSTSKFQRVELEKNRHISPELVYHFRDRLEEIKVIRVRRQYFVYSTFHTKSHEIHNYRGVHNVFGGYDELSPAVDLFRRFVKDYLTGEVYRELF